jgi:hypothetical protein
LVSKISNLCEDLINEETKQLENHHIDDLVELQRFLMDKRKKMMYLIFVRAIQVQNKQKKYNMQGLNGMTWNNEGFHDPNKNLFVHEIVREQKLDFVALLETRRSNFVVPFLKHLAVGSDFSRFYLPPHRRSRGILIGINSAILLVKRVEMANFWVKIYL